MRTTKTREVPPRPTTEFPGDETAISNAALGADPTQIDPHTQLDSPQSQSDQSAEQPTHAPGDIREVRPQMAEEKIRELAYFKWQAAGCPEGDGVPFWTEAETELNNNLQAED